VLRCDEHLKLQLLETQGVRFDTEFTKLTISPFPCDLHHASFNHFGDFGVLLFDLKLNPVTSEVALCQCLLLSLVKEAEQIKMLSWKSVF